MGPLANKVWIQPESLAGSAPRPCGHEDLGRILQPQVVGASGAAQQASVRKQAQQSSVRALPHACRQSSGGVRVLNVRIDWHVKRPTNKKVKRKAVRSQAGEGLAGRREQIECT